MKKFYLLIILMLLPLLASADAVEINGIYYNLIPKGNAAEVTNVSNHYYSGDVVIPGSFEHEGVEYNVVKILDEAFKNCYALTSVSVPGSVKSIGKWAFGYCTKLKTVTLADGIESLDEHAFHGCEVLESVSLPASVKTVGREGFAGCKAMTSVTLSGNMTTLVENLFINCSSLNSVIIPEGVTTLEGNVFNGCSALTSVTIPSSVTSIGDQTFYKCVNLQSVTIPNSVTSLGTGTFHGCSVLTSAVLPEGLKELPGSTFRECTSLTEFTIPSQVETIGNFAFFGCVGLSTVHLPAGLTTINEGTFQGCTVMETIELPAGLNVISNSVFKNCTALTSVNIPSNMTSIGTDAFKGCVSLVSVALPDNLTQIGDCAFEGCSGLKTLQFGDGKESLYLGFNAFKDCISLTKVTLPDNLSKTWSNECHFFQGCTGLKTVSFGTGITEIGNQMFNGCTSLEEIVIPDQVTAIRNGAFMGCTKLTQVILGSGLQSIGANAFASCDMLVKVYCYSQTPPSAFSDESTYDSFKGSSVEYITLYVGKDYLSAYGALKPWSDFKAILAIEDNKPVINGDGESITITAAKQSTYCSDKNLDFSSKPNLKAYVATGYDKTTGTIWLTRVKDVPANTGFLLMGDAGNYVIPVKDGVSDSYYVNLFKGTLTSMKLQATDGANTNYYLSNGSYGVGFYKPSSDGVDLGANRAYLSVPTDIQPVGAAGGTETINVSSALQMTYCSNNSLDFTDWDQVKAYTATGYNYNSGTIWLTRVKKVPAGTGILIMAPEGSYPITKASVASVYANMFVGTLGGKTIQTEEKIGDVDYINYYLSAGTYGVGFYKVTQAGGVSLSPNRSYLPIPKRTVAGTRGISSDTERYGIRESDDVIAIRLFQGEDAQKGFELIENASSKMEKDVFYNLQGQRVNNPGKGLYIKNGKKIVIK